MTALARGQHDVGTGVIPGSNVFNLAALIGLGAVYLEEQWNSQSR